MAIIPGKWDEMTRDEHGDARALYGAMNGVFRVAKNNTDKPEVLKACAEALEEIEFFMQGFWGFDRDSKFHRYWYMMPGCTCPKMDNEEHWGRGKIHVSDCPVHGHLVPVE